ncbi:striatin-interacting protein 1 homolog [Eupeodes corollae]|uniref:striatin-interacting protein 1 homolog n=1 Tax=Eupeodes corollae TaxID=290404 RepID=UPI002490E53F|nr:striatin-interacting protein 1 homolog [Eupeodes corollae]
MKNNSDEMLSSINNSFEQEAHDIDGNYDGPDLDFIYSDVDSYQNEIAELYSYTEFGEFQLNVKAFEDQMEMYNLPPNWQKQDFTTQKSIIMKLIDQLEVSNRTFRMQAARCILYLAQGCWAEVQSDEEQHQNTRDNVIVLYELGVFASFIDLLNMEIDSAASADCAAIKISNVSLADSTDLRVILSVLYIITETIRDEKEKDSEDYKNIAESFVNEINSPFGDELLSVKLLGMITRFCSGAAPHFPMKKVLLLLWKISLVGLGGMEVLKNLKNEYRMRCDLPPNTEDTMEITKCMRASSPPATATDILDNQNIKRNVLRRSLIKQRFLDEQEQMDMELQSGEGEEDLTQYYRPFDDPSNNGGGGGGGGNVGNNGCPGNNQRNELPIHITTRLPWTPKVRQKDVDQFLDISRNKFIGYSLINDHESLAGLPQPIHEGVKTLRKHMYTSLADIQIRKEEEIARNPISTQEDEIQVTPAEILYQAILPNLPQYMIALLKVLLAASPTSKSKTESINIMADVLPKEMPMTLTQSTRLAYDVSRHKEIIVKAVSAIILLYLKHFKINHIYQFEFMSQHLVFANCIPLVLKFFNQTITEYVSSENAIPLLDFPSCVIGEQPELTCGESVVYGDNSLAYSWRNVFSCINLLRILNKLIKWKHSRVMMLVVFKSAPILKKTLKVRHAMMQLYVLKLLKMQTKYLGRQWRKSNMKTMSAIYAKVRHRLNDDWAFGNDLESRPWDFQAEECTLRACVDRFNLRRYPEAMQKCGAGSNGNTANAENAIMGNGMGGAGTDPNTVGQSQYNEANDGVFPNDEILSHADFAFFGHSGWWDKKIELTDNFKSNYTLWLQDEVYNTQIDWDSI